MFNSSFEHGVTDIRRIELNEDYEFRFWTSRFGCNSRELVDALVAVGIDADAVAAPWTGPCSMRISRMISSRVRFAGTKGSIFLWCR